MHLKLNRIMRERNARTRNNFHVDFNIVGFVNYNA